MSPKTNQKSILLLARKGSDCFYQSFLNLRGYIPKKSVFLPLKFFQSVYLVELILIKFMAIRKSKQPSQQRTLPVLLTSKFPAAVKLLWKINFMLVCSSKAYWVVIKENWHQLWEYQKGLMLTKRNCHVHTLLPKGPYIPRTFGKTFLLGAKNFPSGTLTKSRKMRVYWK